MSAADVDLVVVGAGLAGLAAARHAVARGRVGRRARGARPRRRPHAERATSATARSSRSAGSGSGRRSTGCSSSRASSASRRSRRTPRASRRSSGAARSSATAGLIPRINPAILLDYEQARRRLDRLARTRRRRDAVARAGRARARRADVPHVAAAQRRAPRARASFSSSICEAVWAAEPADVSLLHVLFYIRSAGSLETLIGTEGGAQEARFVGGSQLHRRCGWPRSSATSCGCRRRCGAIAWDADGVTRRATSARGASIVALPPTLTVAHRLRPAAARLPRPAHPADAAGHGVEVHGRLRRAVLAARRPQRLRARATPGPVRLTYDNSPPDGSPGVLLGFLEGDHARRAGPAARGRAARRGARRLRAAVRRPRARPERYVEKSWAEEEWTRGCYGCYMTPGGWTSYGAALRAPIGPIHWAGAETATIWNGYMDGAVRSGERAAAEALRALGLDVRGRLGGRRRPGPAAGTTRVMRPSRDRASPSAPALPTAAAARRAAAVGQAERRRSRSRARRRPSSTTRAARQRRVPREDRGRGVEPLDRAAVLRDRRDRPNSAGRTRGSRRADRRRPSGGRPSRRPAARGRSRRSGRSARQRCRVARGLRLLGVAARSRRVGAVVRRRRSRRGGRARGRAARRMHGASSRQRRARTVAAVDDLERLRTATDAPRRAVRARRPRGVPRQRRRHGRGARAAMPIRVASKSVRCRRAARATCSRGPATAGVLAFTLPEALWLHGARRRATSSSPTRPRTARALRDARRRRQAAAAQVDDHGRRRRAARPRRPRLRPAGRSRAPIRVCLDLDASWRPLSGRLRVGARRSPLHAPARGGGASRGRSPSGPGFRLVGLMAYEAQIAGVGDAPPGAAVRAAAIRAMQAGIGPRARAAPRARSSTRCARSPTSSSSTAAAPAASSARRARDAVTEVAAGSGLYGPSLFDAYRSFTPRPAALFALPVVRRPGRRRGDGARRRLPGVGRRGRRPAARAAPAAPG